MPPNGVVQHQAVKRKIITKQPLKAFANVIVPTNEYDKRTKFGKKSSSRRKKGNRARKGIVHHVRRTRDDLGRLEKERLLGCGSIDSRTVCNEKAQLPKRDCQVVRTQQIVEKLGTRLARPICHVIKVRNAQK